MELSVKGQQKKNSRSLNEELSGVSKRIPIGIPEKYVGQIPKEPVNKISMKCLKEFSKKKNLKK